MADFTHMAARLAFSKGIDIMLRKMQKDRVRGMLDLVDIVEKFEINNPIDKNAVNEIVNDYVYEILGLFV